MVEINEKWEPNAEKDQIPWCSGSPNGKKDTVDLILQAQSVLVTKEGNGMYQLRNKYRPYMLQINSWINPLESTSAHKCRSVMAEYAFFDRTHLWFPNTFKILKLFFHKDWDEQPFITVRGQNKSQEALLSSITQKIKRKHHARLKPKKAT